MVEEKPLDLQQALIECFNLNEMRQICFELGIDYDDILGNTPTDKSRELILFLHRRNKLHQLVYLCSQKRDHIDWSYLLKAYEKGKNRYSFAKREIVVGSSIFGLIAILLAFIFGGTIATVISFAIGIILIVILILFVVLDDA